MTLRVKAVIDASAMLAFVNREPGCDVVRGYLRGSVMSAVNYAEVLQKLVERSYEQTMLNDVISNLRIEIVPFDRMLAEQVARLYPVAHKGVSLADRACMSLGLAGKLPIVTDDYEWEELGLGMELV
ncbi:MAG: type II toxin-antitoxin system VapC family toxin, partial [Nitrospira sp.]